VHLNDFNRSIYLFWKTVLDQTDELCKLIHKTKVNAREWHKQQRILDTGTGTDLEIGFATFFMNRCNRSGIINGGMIGGKQQNGKWKIDARFNKQSLISRIRRIASYRNRISLYNLDAEQFLTRINGTLPCKTLIYLDPPYYLKGAGLYEDHYRHHDHERLAKFVQRRLKHHWIVSYDNHPQIRKMYAERQRIEYQLSYTAKDRYFGTEVMFFSDELVIPKVPNPARHSAQPKTPIRRAKYRVPIGVRLAQTARP
jgi:DNA adenine methylase